MRQLQSPNSNLNRRVGILCAIFFRYDKYRPSNIHKNNPSPYYLNLMIPRVSDHYMTKSITCNISTTKPKGTLDTESLLR